MTFEQAATLQDLLDLILNPGLSPVLVEMRGGWGVVTMTQDRLDAILGPLT